MAEFIAIGDLHLTSPNGKDKVTGGLSAYIKDSDEMVFKLVKQALKYADKHHIKDIILLGDIAERTRLTYEAMLVLSKLFKLPYEFHIILGNHDLYSGDPTLGHSMQVIQEFCPSNVHIYDQPTKVQFGKASVNFLPWPHQDFDPSPRCMNVAHVDVHGAKSDSGRLFEGETLTKSKAHAVIGHIHTRQKIRNSWYPGTLYQTNFGEAADKYFAHITYEGKGNWDVQNIPVKPIYTLHTVEVLTKSDLKGVPASEHDLIKLILLDGCEVNADQYKHLNVVMVKAVSNARELALARVEDLSSGSEIEVNTEEFFHEWLEAQSVDADLKKQALKIRKQVLGGIK